MSTVSNYLVEFGWTDFNENDIHLIRAINKELDEGFEVGIGDNIPSLHQHYEAYMGSKVLETDSYLYALNYVWWEDFVECVDKAIELTNWISAVQVLYKSYDCSQEFWKEIYRHDNPS